MRFRLGSDRRRKEKIGKIFYKRFHFHEQLGNVPDMKNEKIINNKRKAKIIEWKFLIAKAKIITNGSLS